MTERSEPPDKESRPEAPEPPPFSPDPDLIAEREKGWEPSDKEEKSRQGRVLLKDDKSTPEPVTHQPGDGGEEPPPFRPDPRLVTYLERGRKDDAPERFRRALRDLEKRSS
jgi:hypothetical protein